MGERLQGRGEEHGFIVRMGDEQNYAFVGECAGWRRWSDERREVPEQKEEGREDEKEVAGHAGGL